MAFTEKTFDLKKFTRAVKACPGETESERDPDELGPEHLKPCLFSAYIQILREDTITIADLDFDEIGDGDIDDLETVLHDSPANGLFDVCEVFRGFEPAAAAKRAFI